VDGSDRGRGVGTGAGGVGGGSPRPGHLIAPGEVNAWLADSAVKSVTYHRTSHQAARDIIAHGIDPSRSFHAAYGQGFYTSTVPDEFFGETQLAIAVRSRNPLAGPAAAVEQIVDDMLWRLRPQARGRMMPDVAMAIRRELLRLGYDGMVIGDAGGDGVDYVVVIAPGTAKVVIEQ
jgi:hypothetical protein